MWFWNRIEIYCGYSLKEFSDLRTSLASNGIRYDYKMINRNKSRARVGTLGQNPHYDTLYYLYVHRKDYECAMYCTSQKD